MSILCVFSDLSFGRFSLTTMHTHTHSTYASDGPGTQIIIVKLKELRCVCMCDGWWLNASHKQIKNRNVILVAHISAFDVADMRHASHTHTYTRPDTDPCGDDR